MSSKRTSTSDAIDKLNARWGIGYNSKNTGKQNANSASYSNSKSNSKKKNNSYSQMSAIDKLNARWGFDIGSGGSNSNSTKNSSKQRFDWGDTETEKNPKAEQPKFGEEMQKKQTVLKNLSEYRSPLFYSSSVDVNKYRPSVSDLIVNKGSVKKPGREEFEYLYKDYMTKDELDVLHQMDDADFKRLSSAVDKRITEAYNDMDKVRRMQAVTDDDVRPILQANGIPETVYGNGFLSRDEWDNLSDDEKQHKAYGLYVDEWLGEYYDLQGKVAEAGERRRENTDSGASGWDIAGDAIMSGLGTFNKGLFATLDWLLPTEYLPGKDLISDLNDYYSGQDDYYKSKLAEDLRGKSKTTKFLAQLGEGTVAAAPNAILALMTGGTSLGASGATLTGQGLSAMSNAQMLSTATQEMLKNPQFWTSFAQMAGTDYEEAKANGASELEATLSAFTKGFMNSAIEVGGGVDLLPKKLQEEEGKAFAKWLISSLEEGIEEPVQSVVSGSVDKAIYDHDKEIFSMDDENAIINPGRLIEEAVMGTGVGMGLGGLQTGGIKTANYIANRGAKQQPVSDIELEGILERVAQEKLERENKTVTEDIPTPTKAVETTEQGIKTGDEFYFPEEKRTYKVIDKGEKSTTFEVTSESGTITKKMSNNLVEKHFTDGKRVGGTAEVASVTETAPTSLKGKAITAETLNEMSKNNEAVSAEDVKSVTRFGDAGAKVVTDLANTEGVTFERAKSTVQTAYLAGYTNQTDIEANLKTSAEKSAYNAGMKDRSADDSAWAKSNQKVTTYETGFTENEHSKKLNGAERRMFSFLAKDLKMEASMIDEIIASYVDGNPQYANARHTDGRLQVALNSDNDVFEDAMHESGHRMAELDTDAWNTLMNALYAQTEELGRRSALGNSYGMEFDSTKTNHDDAGIYLGTRDIIEEIGVQQLGSIFRSPEAFNKWRKTLDTHPEVKSAWKSFVKWFRNVLESIKRKWATRKLSDAQKAKAKKAFAEADRMLKLFEDAYVASMQSADARANEAAFEAGKANVPRENVTLATKAQEDAYNKGRLEHIKNLKNKPVTKEKVEVKKGVAEQPKKAQTEKKQSYTQSDGDVRDSKTKYSIREGFYAEFDEWLANGGKDTNVKFVIGNTSDVLKSVGVKNQEIKLNSGTVIQKLNAHKEMTPELFKKIPELLEQPIIVQFSDAIDRQTQKQKYESRITVLGELYAEVSEDGEIQQKPVLVSLELMPTNQKGTVVLDFSIITSAYAKDALQNYLAENTILYINPDKKRTNKWLSLNRLQLPLGETKYGSVRMITYIGRKVKVQNSVNKSSMQTALENAGLVDEFGKMKVSPQDSEAEKNKPSSKYSLKLATEGNHKEKIANVYSQVVDENGNILKDADGNPMVAVDLKTLIQRYDKVLDIWERVSKKLDFDFLNNWNNTVGKDRAFTVFKEQAGYKYNIELSSKCKKAIPLFEAIDEIVKTEAAKELKSGKIGKVEKEILYNILKKKGFEIPCAICYVEQARQREGEIIKGFLDGNKVQKKNGTYETYKIGWNEALHEIENRMKAKGIDFKFPKLSRDAATDAYTPADLTMDRATQTAFYEVLKDVTNEEIKRYNSQPSRKGKKSIPLIKNAIPEGVNSVLKGSLPLNLRMFKTMFNEPTSRFIIDSDLLYSSMTTKNLASFHNGLYSVFNSQGGSGGYKTKQGTVAYWGDLLGKKWNPKKLRGEGAIRNQSNSDLMMYTLLDQVQMYIDLTAKGYYLHAYTKVPAELKLFGLSGAKINASGIPKVVVYRNADRSEDVAKTQMNAGLDENGNPIYDFIEGINIDEAFMLVEDKEYSKSLCVVCIGYSDKHIEKLLDDDRIGMIIGFHDKTDNPDKRYYGARYAHNYNGVNEAAKKKADGTYETKHINFNQFIEKAEKKLKKKSSVEFGGKTYEYNDIPRLAADLYLEYCNEKGLSPAYSRCGIDFSKHPNYYKLLTDYGLYDSEGNYAPMQKVNFNMPDKVPYLDNGKVAYMDTEAYIQKELASELRVMDSISNALSDKSEGGIIPEFIRRANESFDADSEQRTSHSLKGSPTSRSRITSEFLDAVEDVKNGKADASSRLAKYVDSGLISTDDYQAMIEEFGAIPKGEKPHRDITVPKKTEKDKNVSQTVRTILEAEVTPSEIVPTIEKMVEDGIFSYDTYTDKQAIKDADDYIKGYGWDESLKDWFDDVEKGIVSKQHTAVGWALYNNAVNLANTTTSDTEKTSATKTALNILDAMVHHQRNAAQALQATRILKKLSPETQLYHIQKTVNKLQKETDERKFGHKKDEKFANDAKNAVTESRNKAGTEMANAYKNGKVSRRGKRVVIEGNMVGEPFVFEYAQKVGESLAKSLEAKRNVTSKEKTFLQHITSQLKRFANEKLPVAEKGKQLTAVQMLCDYIQNQDFYNQAWAEAQQELRSKYADDEMFNEFINTGIGMDANINPRNAIFMRALVMSATESNETKSAIIRQSSLGVTKISENIAEKLIADTGAEGEMAQTIKDAAASYVHSVLVEAENNTENPLDAEKLVTNAIKGAMKDIGIKLSEAVTSGKVENAKQAIIDKLITKYAFGVAEATNTAEIVARQFEAMSKQYASKRLEGMFKERKHNRKTISEQLQLLGNLGAFDIGSKYNSEAAKRIFKKDAPLHIDETLAQKFLEAKTDDERLDIEIEIYKDIGSQLPSTFRDKWNAWRYLAMLGNLRTHGRNIVGNAGFAPVVLAKDLTATAIESAVYYFGGRKILRSKALIRGSKADRVLLKAAWDDYNNVADMVSNGGKYNDAKLSNKYIEEGRKKFKSKLFAPVEWLRRKNSAALEVEDVWFSKPHYAYALAQYCKANNITADQIKRGMAIAPARDYAIKEASKATYKDINRVSQWVSKIGRNVVVEGILPFRRTPANILVRGVEYSPIGLIKSLTYDLVQVGKGEMMAHEVIDNISAGLTGTGLLYLGFVLAAEGLIRGHGGDDEKEKKFEELMGHQAYSLELPNGTSVTLDWLAPEALPFFVGANIYETTKGNNENLNMSSIITAVTSVSEPMLEMSCLQGVNDMIEGVGNASSNETSGLVALLSSAVTSYLTQGIPTLSGQFERSSEEERMTTYTEKKAFLTGDMQYTLGKASAKIPGWDYGQIPYIDAWGRREASGTALKRGLNNFLNPAYTSTIEESDMEKELLRLYESTGEASVFPQRADKYFTVDKERKDLTADEYVRYATLKGEKSLILITELVQSKAYKELDDEEKVKAIEDAYDYANQKAKQAISNYQPQSWVGKADEFGNDVETYLAFKTKVATKSDNGDKMTKQEVADIILDMTDKDSTIWGLYLSMYDKENIKYAHDNGIKGEDYLHFLEMLDEVDEPTESGKYGTYTQDEAAYAIDMLDLSWEEKAILWQSVNTSWKEKNNPFR